MKKVKINVDLEFLVEDDSKFIGFDEDGTLVCSNVPIKKSACGDWEVKSSAVSADAYIFEINSVLNWRKTLREIS